MHFTDTMPPGLTVDHTNSIAVGAVMTDQGEPNTAEASATLTVLATPSGQWELQPVELERVLEAQIQQHRLLV